MKKFFTKTILILFGISIICFPQKSLAGSDYGASQIADTIKDVAQRLLEEVYASMRDVISKKIMDYIADKTLTWVQGGGDPKFVTNLGSYLNEQENLATESVIKDIAVAEICPPYYSATAGSELIAPTGGYVSDGNIIMGPGESYNAGEYATSSGYISDGQVIAGEGQVYTPKTAESKSFTSGLKCTLTDVVNNVQDFYSGKEFSFKALSSFWEPQNNPLGQQMLIYDEVVKRQGEAASLATEEYNAGGGYLSVKRCKGGGISQDAYSNSLEDYLDYSGDASGTFCPTSEMESITPGKTISDILAKSITSDIDWASGIENPLTMIFTTVVDSFVNNAIGVVGSSVSGGSGHDVSDPQTIEIKKKQLKSNIDEILGRATTAKTIKSESLTYANQILTALNTLKSKGCGNVSDSDLQIAQDEANRLQKEVDVINTVITEGNSLLAKLDKATNEELTNIMTECSSFISSGGSTILAYSGDATTKERDTKKEKAQSLESQLLFCN